MTHFSDTDIGDLAEEVVGTIDGLRRALKSRLPDEIAASKRREEKLRALAVRILEELGRRPLAPPAIPVGRQLTIFDNNASGGLPD